MKHTKGLPEIVGRIEAAGMVAALAGVVAHEGVLTLGADGVGRRQSLAILQSVENRIRGDESQDVGTVWLWERGFTFICDPEEVEARLRCKFEEEAAA